MSARPRRPKVVRWVAAVAVLAALAAGLTVLLRRRAVEVRVAPVARGDLLVRVLCDGNLEPPAGGELRATEAGSVAALDAAEGARVARGQVLLELANPELEAQARAARAELDRLAAERIAAAAELARAEREAAYRDQVWASDRRLLAERAIPRVAADADELAARQAADQVRRARADLGALDAAAPGGASRLALARANAAALDRRVAALTVRSPAGGLVYGLPRSRGEAVAAGQLLATVTDPEHPHVRFRIDQPDLPRVAAGQPIVVTFNGQPDRQWRGTVRSVGTGLREVGGRQVGEALGDLAEPAAALPANASVDVQVIVARRAGVLIAPRAALRREGEQRYVFQVVGRHAYRRNVEVGLIGLAEVEITRGLAGGDLVVLDAPPTLAEGMRVTALKP